MPFIVRYDANALYGNAQRDLLIRIARAGSRLASATTVSRNGNTDLTG
jgi:hypothetical protein